MGTHTFAIPPLEREAQQGSQRVSSGGIHTWAGHCRRLFDCSLLLYPLYVLIETPLADGISRVVVVSATIWLYGYLLRGEAGSSIGLWRGGKVFAVELVLFLAFLFSFAYVIVLAVSALT